MSFSSLADNVYFCAKGLVDLPVDFPSRLCQVLPRRKVHYFLLKAFPPTVSTT